MWLPDSYRHFRTLESLRHQSQRRVGFVPRFQGGTPEALPLVNKAVSEHLYLDGTRAAVLLQSREVSEAF
jgi:hypothetical protein